MGVEAAPRVLPLFHGTHFDDIQKDCLQFTCPPVLLAVYSSSECKADFDALKFTQAARALGDRNQLFMGKYDLDTLKDVWWEHTADTDLGSRLGVQAAGCPHLVFAPHNDLSAAAFWDPSAVPDWKKWARDQLAVRMAVKNSGGVPLSVEVNNQRHGDTLEPGETRDFSLTAGQRMDVLVDSESGAAGAGTAAWSQVAHFAFNRVRHPFAVAADGGLDASEGAGAAHSAEDLALYKTQDLMSRDQDTTFRHSSILRQTPHLPGHSPLG
jgi:hypothetical protein